MDEDLLLAGTLATPATIDISETPDNAEAAVNLGKVGLPDQCYFVVVITAGSAEAVVPVTWEFQFTDDNGSTWHTVGTITANVVTGPAAFAVPVGLASFAPEGIASASIDVRVNTSWTEVEVDDNISYNAFLAGPQGFPFFN